MSLTFFFILSAVLIAVAFHNLETTVDVIETYRFWNHRIAIVRLNRSLENVIRTVTLIFITPVLQLDNRCCVL